MGKKFNLAFSEDDASAFYQCYDCGNNLTHSHEAMSANFRGRTGAATLFANVVNVILGPLEHSRLSTGLHIIRAVYCSNCLENLGWYYETAFENDQKYKEGHYILEDSLIESVLPEDSDLSGDEPLLSDYNNYGQF